MVSLPDLLRAELGVSTFEALNRLTGTVGVAAVRVLSNNPNRVVAVFSNPSASLIRVWLFSDISSTRGYRVEANGGTIVLFWKEDYTLVSHEWFALGDAADLSFLTLELLTVPGGAEGG